MAQKVLRAAVNRATGLRTGPDGLGGVRFLGEDGAPFLTLSRVYAREIAAHPDLMAPRLALLRDWHAGKLTGAALEARVRELYVDVVAPDANEVVGSVGGLEILNAVRAADAHARTVGHRERAIALLAPALLPVPLDARDLAVGILIGVLPVVSQVDAGLEAAASFRDADAALDRGDYGTAIALTALGLVSLASLTPGAGALLRPLSRVLTRAIRTTPGLRKVHASVTLNRALRRKPGEAISPRTVFGDQWDKLSQGKQGTLEGLFPHIQRRATEADAEDLLQELGTKFLPSKRFRRRGDDAFRVYDQAIQQGLRKWLVIFVVKDKRKIGTGIEIKSQSARPNRRQRDFDEDARNQGLESVPKKGSNETVHRIDDAKILNLRLDAVPEETLAREARFILENGKGQRFSPEQVDALVGGLLDWRKNSHQSGLSLGQALLALATATGALAAGDDLLE